MAFTIETRAPGSTDWRVAPFSLTDLQHAQSILSDLTNGLKVTEVRLLEDGVVLTSIGRFSSAYPNPQNLPKVSKLAASGSPFWECPAAVRRRLVADSAWCVFNLQGHWYGSLSVQIGRFLMAASPTRIIEEAGDVQNTLCRPTADAAEFLYRYYPRNWSSKPHRPIEWLKSCKPEWIRNEAANVQLALATPTADKLQQVLVGYVSR